MNRAALLLSWRLMIQKPLCFCGTPILNSLQSIGVVVFETLRYEHGSTLV